MRRPSSIAAIAGMRVAVVAAHPDDEIIGAGASIARWPHAAVIHVTDGAPRDGADAARAGFADWRGYAAARRREAAAALALAGVPADRVVALDCPDQQAAFRLADIARRLDRLLRDLGCQCVVAHAYEGGHPDHDAAAFAVHAACRLMAGPGRQRPTIIEMTGYHAGEGGPAIGAFLPQPGAGPEFLCRLGAAAQRRKRAMLACHETQGALLASFGVAAERFRLAPDYDFTAPPHAGRLHYENYAWGIDGAGWRNRATEALRELALAAPS